MGANISKGWLIIIEIKSEIILPFKLPIKDGLKQLSKYHFAEMCVTYNTIEDGYDLELNNVNALRTALSITYYPTNGIENETDHVAIARSFILNCIYHINKLVDAMRITYGLSYLHRITVRDLPTVIVVEIDDECLAYFTNSDIIQEQVFVITQDDFAHVTSVMSSIDMYPEIYTVDTFYESAKTALNKEQFTNFIVDIQTSFEVFIRNTHRLILKHEGKNEDHIMKCEGYSFRNVIEDHLAGYLKEDLGFQSNKYINNWYTKIYLVRNEIVHRGRQLIDGHEAYTTINAYEDTRNYLSDLLLKEGYLNQNGKVDLNLFKKNDIDYEGSMAFLERMKAKGLVDKDLILKCPK